MPIARCCSPHGGTATALEGLARSFFLALVLSVAAPTSAATIQVDCSTGASVGPALAKLVPGDVLLVQGTCRENVVIHSEVNGVTVDGQGEVIRCESGAYLDGTIGSLRGNRGIKDVSDTAASIDRLGECAAAACAAFRKPAMVVVVPADASAAPARRSAIATAILLVRTGSAAARSD